MLSGVFVLAPLAALVSTMDSQLLALASIIAKDAKVPVARAASLIYALAAFSAILALFPPADILAFLNKASFLGYAALFPTLFGIFYSKKASAVGALASMIAGEATVFVLGFGFWSSGNVPAIFIVAGAAILAWTIGNRVPAAKAFRVGLFCSRRFYPARF